ncbi:MAG: hypothetical protein R6X10_00545 [Desulfobacterales bacterium]
MRGIVSLISLNKKKPVAMNRHWLTGYFPAISGITADFFFEKIGRGFKNQIFLTPNPFISTYVDL